MKTIFKYAATVALTGALALAAASPGEARNGRNAAAIGFGVGAAVAGAAIASSAYNNGYTDITAIRVTPMARATLMRRAMPMTTHTPMRRPGLRLSLPLLWRQVVGSTPHQQFLG